MKEKLIILDMDNTILQSHIDFPLMRERIYAILEENGAGDCKRHSVADTLTVYADSAGYDAALADKMWRIVADLEERGLDQAVLEPGAEEALAYLARYARLAVLTNNTDENLAMQVQTLGILPYLSFVAGRGSVPRLKPAPDGLLYIMRQFPGIPRGQVIAVGDATIDAISAAAAGIVFAAYNRSRKEQWEAHGLRPALRLTAWSQDACDALLGLVGG